MPEDAGLGPPHWLARAPKRSVAQAVAASVLAAVALAMIPAAPARAAGNDACAPEQTVRWRGGTLRLENDLFTGTDRNYTNGVSLNLVSRDIPGRPPQPWAKPRHAATAKQ